MKSNIARKSAAHPLQTLLALSRKVLSRMRACRQAPTEDRRVIIIHNHIFKNAGSSIDWALHRNFQHRFIDHREDRKMLQGPAYLRAYLLNNPHVTALSTHHLRPPLPELEHSRILTIMMFRHPLERVTSVYHFERKQTGSETYGARFAREHSLKDYVLWRMRSDVPPTIRNFHIFRSLPEPVHWRRPLGPDDLEKAKEFVRSVDMLGFVDSFDKAMICFENVLAPFFPNIDLSYKIQNVGQNIDQSLEERLQRLRDELGAEAYECLENNNKWDLKLYAYARKLFEARLEKIHDLQQKLYKFQDRCQKRRKHLF